jgi:transcriptional regulator with XRE-family HTH domain
VISQNIFVKRGDHMRNWLVEARGKRTQVEVAERAGLTQQMYSAIERGTATPSVSAAKRIARALGLTDWIRFYDDADKEVSNPKAGASA